MSEALAVSQPATPAGADRPPLVRRVSTSLANSRSLTVGITLVAVWVFFWVRDPNDVFLSARNLSNLTLQITVTGLLALGLVFVLLIGEIDLSVAALSGVSAAVPAATAISTSLRQRGCSNAHRAA